MHRIATTAIPLQSQVCCNSLSPDNEKLMLGCIDGSVVIFDENRGITHLVKAAFVCIFFVLHKIMYRLYIISKQISDSNTHIMAL